MKGSELIPCMRCWNYYAINFVNSDIFVIVIPRLDLVGVIENKIKKSTKFSNNYCRLLFTNCRFALSCLLTGYRRTAD
jgi:hypothetical protein